MLIYIVQPLHYLIRYKLVIFIFYYNSQLYDLIFFFLFLNFIQLIRIN